jgi:hypothetical protein
VEEGLEETHLELGEQEVVVTEQTLVVLALELLTLVQVAVELMILVTLAALVDLE